MLTKLKLSLRAETIIYPILDEINTEIQRGNPSSDPWLQPCLKSRASFRPPLDAKALRHRCRLAGMLAGALREEADEGEDDDREDQ